MINIAFINCCIYNLSLRFRREKLNSLELDRTMLWWKQQFCSVAAKVTNSKQKVLLFTLSIFSALLNFEKKKEDDGFWYVCHRGCFGDGQLLPLPPVPLVPHLYLSLYLRPTWWNLLTGSAMLAITASHQLKLFSLLGPHLLILCFPVLIWNKDSSKEISWKSV